VDPTDPDPATAAGRELWEETGYAAGAIEQIGVIAPNPAIQNNRCHSFLATGLHHKGGQPIDTTEEVEVEKIPLSEIPELIKSGEICHALVVVAFCFLLTLQPPDLAIGRRS
jgi:ADP-ribose pyrophosphatase YjhB (NUDIX family)